MQHFYHLPLYFPLGNGRKNEMNGKLALLVELLKRLLAWLAKPLPRRVPFLPPTFILNSSGHG